MIVHLKRGEKIYINGAVLRVDRRTSLEFLNDVSFLLENHVMQVEEAVTPLRQLYFVVQTMLIDPGNAGMTVELYKHLSHRVHQSAAKTEIRTNLDFVDMKMTSGRYFEALKMLRSCFALEDASISVDMPAVEAAA